MTLHSEGSRRPKTRILGTKVPNPGLGTIRPKLRTMSEDVGVSRRATWLAITVDGEQPQRVAEFWAAVFECEVIRLAADRPGWFRLQPRGTTGPFMNFQPVIEPNAGKVRIHVDVLTADLDALFGDRL